MPPIILAVSLKIGISKRHKIFFKFKISYWKKKTYNLNINIFLSKNNSLEWHLNKNLYIYIKLQKSKKDIVLKWWNKQVSFLIILNKTRPPLHYKPSLVDLKSRVLQVHFLAEPCEHWTVPSKSSPHTIIPHIGRFLMAPGDSSSIIHITLFPCISLLGWGAPEKNHKDGFEQKGLWDPCTANTA